MTEDAAKVVVIDDDPSVREAIRRLLQSVGLQVEVFGSVKAFLDAGLPAGPACMVLDVRLPGQSGLDFQAELAKAQIRLPVIFITGHGDVQMSVRAMKAGAVEFLTKPFRDQDLLDAIQVALGRDRARVEAEAGLAGLRRREAGLTAREREVMAQVVSGRVNKQIAAELGVSEITVKAHRGQVMRKMGARSVADLVRMADRLAAGADVRLVDPGHPADRSIP
ncbi:MAG: two component transcriptional regulator, LuxR family [Phenylobacterium sp.]|nr:two component transcriptional regulator, LuxR family [Phenylobacterium sp.]